MHPNDGALLALIHGELDADAAASLQAHLSSCAACAARSDELSGADTELGALLRALDHPVPRLAVPAAAARRPRLRHTALAASLALLIAGAAAAAVPGTALNRWIRSRLDGAPPTAPQVATPAPATVQPPAQQAAAGGVEIPASRTLVVTFAAPEPDGVLTVSVADRTGAAFRAYGGDVAYEVGDGRIAVDNRRPARRYTLEVSSALGRLTVLVAGRPAFDSAQRPLGNAPDSISLSPSPAR